MNQLLIMSTTDPRAKIILPNVNATQARCPPTFQGTKDKLFWKNTGQYFKKHPFTFMLENPSQATVIHWYLCIFVWSFAWIFLIYGTKCTLYQGFSNRGRRLRRESPWWAGPVCLPALSAGLANRGSHWPRITAPGQWELPEAAASKSLGPRHFQQLPPARSSNPRPVGAAIMGYGNSTPSKAHSLK